MLLVVNSFKLHLTTFLTTPKCSLVPGIIDAIVVQYLKRVKHQRRGPPVASVKGELK